MNIRMRKISTHVYGDYKDVEVSTIFGDKIKKAWVDGSNTIKEILEFLDPVDAKWKPIPTTTEYVYHNL